MRRGRTVSFQHTKLPACSAQFRAQEFSEGFSFRTDSIQLQAQEDPQKVEQDI